MNKNTVTAQGARDLAKACIIRAGYYWKSQLYACYRDELNKAQAWETLANELEAVQ